MRKLDRSVAVKPRSWDRTARSAVPDFAVFIAEATAFEALPLNGTVRRDGFPTYAPHALPKSKGKAYFKSVWGKHKEPIARISKWQCAYCECSINAERVGQVEHFKPKAIFPLSAYDWDNYLLACGGCNGPKSDKWPRGAAYVRPDDAAYDPALHFRFKGDGDVDAISANAAETVHDFELKRQLLIDDRKKFIELARAQIKNILETYALSTVIGLRQAREAHLRFSDPAQCPYSTAVTQFVLNELQAAIPGFSV